MIKDVRNYFQTVANRLSNVFSLESFDTEQELEFWALAAEHVSREETPNFVDVVKWMDLLYEAPIHFVYRMDKHEKLKLFRRHILSENVINKTEGEISSAQQETIKDFQEQLQNLETTISWRQDFLNIGISKHGIGSCEHIPLFDEGEIWGIYCVGPFVRSPEDMSAKLPIVARILSAWMVEMGEKERRPDVEYEARAEKELGNLGTGRLNIDRIAHLLVGYLVKLLGAREGAVLELTDSGFKYLAKIDLSEQLEAWFEKHIADASEIHQVEKTLTELMHSSEEVNLDNIQFTELTTEYAQALLFMGYEGQPSLSNQELKKTISDLLNELLVYRNQNDVISGRLVDTYYKMLRELEKQKEHTYHHTPRMIALVEQFADFFGLEKGEKEQLMLTAKLHDIGYVGTIQLEKRSSVGAEIEHPVIGRILVDSLPIHQDVKDGIESHHEWINGSGTPHGLQEEEISWTGKIIGLFEFIVEFIETHREDDSKSDEEWISTLGKELIDRADLQFDMVLVPTAIEMIEELGWSKCCQMGTDHPEG